MSHSSGIAFAILVTLGAGAEANSDAVLAFLRASRPDVKWLRPVVRGDFTDQGSGESAVLGVNRTGVFVALVLGAAPDDAEIVSSSWRIGQNGIEPHCAKRATLEAEPISLPEFFDDTVQRPRGLRGLRLALPPCMTVHLYWNPEARLFNWWLEEPQPRPSHSAPPAQYNRSLRLAGGRPRASTSRSRRSSLSQRPPSSAGSIR